MHATPSLPFLKQVVGKGRKHSTKLVEAVKVKDIVIDPVLT
jgi:hypothetical protein